MKRACLNIFLLFIAKSAFGAACGQTAFNPFTGKLDCIGNSVVVTSGTLPSGSTNYIQNRNTLQSGAVFYVSSGTVDAGLIASNSSSMSPPITAMSRSNLGQTILLTGEDLFSNVDFTNGPEFTLTFNGPGNRQLTLFDSSQIGNPVDSGFRFIVGFPVGIIDGIAADGSVHRPINFGDPDANIGVGFNTGTISTGIITSQLYVQDGSASKVGLIVQAAAAQSSDINDWTNSSGGVLASVLSNGGLSVLGTGVGTATATFTGPLSTSPVAGTGYGTPGYIFETNGGASAVSWTPIIPSSFSVINTATATTATSWVSTGLKAQIAPRYTGSKIKITVSGTGAASGAVGAKCQMNISNSGVVNLGTNSLASTTDMVIGVSGVGSLGFTWVDSPNTTSATTYTVLMQAAGTTPTCTFCTDGSNQTCSIQVEDIGTP